MLNTIELKAGAASTTITPRESHFLFGYPFVERRSSGTHDDLLSSALYLSDGKNRVLFVSNDVIYISKASTARIRKGISDRTGIRTSNILIAATHTHSAPVTVDLVISANDPVIPKVDKNYLRFMEENSVKAACQAVENATLAEIAIVVGDATGVGTNRHNPEWIKDTDVPALFVKSKNGNEFIGCMVVCNMHPTVLHEDSTLYSGDFPHYARKKLQDAVLGKNRPVIYFTGAAGNQSPRHVTNANTFGEAKRLGQIVADSLTAKLTDTETFFSRTHVLAVQKFINLPKRVFPPVEWATGHRDETKKRFEELKQYSKNSREIRTAEVNWFGSEELLYLSKLSRDKALEKAYQSSLPAEIQIIKVGDWKFVAWPGEVFVEYGIELKSQAEKVALITYANGELQGYIVTKEAEERGYYEAGNAFFGYQAGHIMLAETLKVLKWM